MIIDTHFHAYPAKYLDMMPQISQGYVRGRGYLRFDSQEYLDVLDQYGVNMGVLSCTGGPIEHQGNREKVVELCKAINDTFAEAHERYPQRFTAFARLPMLYMDDCLKELRRCFDELGMHGLMVPTNLAGKYLDEAEFKPFWDEYVPTGKPLFLHPTNAPCSPNWNLYSLHQKMYWPADSTLAISRLVFSGIFDRYPNLKLIGSHLGGMVLNYLDRLNWQEGGFQCKDEPEVYFKKIYYDTAGPIRAPFIKFACDTAGVDQILFGADFPHGTGGKDDEFYPMTLKAMEELDLSAEDKDRIYYKNAQRLFGFKD
jgi:aminocarboxymuconate-semialdehyde decarboxylase